MSEDVNKWLEALGLGKYAATFAEHDVDFRALPALSEQDLKELGVSLGHRRILQQAIATLPESDEALSESQSSSDVSLADTASLAAWERHPGERRPVTMLFADITGSTALTEKLDVEETHDLLYGATQKMCQVLENNRGTVCRFMGDGVMGMFGAPVASEYHAVDGCEAALEMQRAIRDYGSEVKASYGSELQIRVGLHSGEVVVLTVGEGEDVEYDASGPTVPIAARMEQIANPGEVYLTAATQALAASRIDTETLEPVSVKGVSEPVAIFALRGVRSAEEAVTNAARTTFVGRRAELNQFMGMLDTCIEEGHGQTVYVRGDPGIGKTRLVEEFARAATEKGASIQRGLVLPFGVGKGQDAIRSLVRSLLGISAGSAKAARQQAVETALTHGWVGADQVVFINDLLDLPQPTELRALYDAMDNATRNEGKQAVVSTLVTTESNTQPILTTVEDVHWADAITLAHLAALTKTVTECSALLVMTSRVKGDQLDQSWRTTIDGSPFFTIDLGPLRKQDSIALISEFIDSADPLGERCLERAAGNPFFLEQLLRAAQEGSAESLPDSIQTLVLARMDQLDSENKQALRAAAVIGQHFELDALRHLLDDTAYDCRGLVEHHLVRPEGLGYLFAHALIQEGVYASLLKGQRRDLHRRAARFFGERDPVLHAEHLDRAGDAEAPCAYLAAARHQAGQNRYERALQLTNRALEIVPDTKSFALRCLEGELLRNLGSVPESISAYGRASEVAVAEVDRCRAWIGVAEGLRITEEHDALLELLKDAGVLAEAHALSPELARICQLRGNVHFMRGEIAACLRANATSLEHARDAGSPEVEAQALGALGEAEFARGRIISAYGYYHRCIELSREHGLGRIIAANLPMRGHTLLYRNDLEAALNDCRSAAELAAKIRQPRAEMVALVVGSYVADMGDPTVGKEWITSCLRIARRLGARIFEAISLEHLGRFAVQEGAHIEAERLTQEAVTIVRESESGMQFTGSKVLGALALVTGNPDERRSTLKEGEELLRSSAFGRNFLWFYRDAMEVCLQMAEWDEVNRYAQALEEYTSAEPLPWSDFFIARGRALSAFGRGKRDDATTKELKRLRDEAERLGFNVAIPALDEALVSV